MVTMSTMPPPTMSGSASLSAARSPTSTPMPKGAYILWALKARKSRCAGSSGGRMSMGRCGASWAASTIILAPTACAWRASSCTGLTQPETLEAPVMATSSTLPLSSWSFLA